jgi:hypothetical protein
MVVAEVDEWDRLRSYPEEDGRDRRCFFRDTRTLDVHLGNL